MVIFSVFLSYFGRCHHLYSLVLSSTSRVVARGCPTDLFFNGIGRVLLRGYFLLRVALVVASNFAEVLDNCIIWVSQVQ